MMRRFSWFQWIFIGVLLGKTLPIHAQSQVAKLSLHLENRTVEYALAQIEQQTPYRFVYSSNHLDKNRPVNVHVQEKTIYEVLPLLLDTSEVAIKTIDNQIILTPSRKPAKVLYGNVSGKVTDKLTNEPLPGASVGLKGTTKGTATDLKGEFTLTLVPEGSQTLVINYIGYQPEEVTVQVTEGGTARLNVALIPDLQILGEVVVKGSLEGQQKALNQQRTADNIKNIVSADLIGRFPDLNVAEALQRVPGINIERDRGEGGEVQMRGAPPSFTTVNINGEQIVGTQDGGQRNEELSVIPVDQLSSIEVSKAITPDQDGDNIGGTVDLKTPTAKNLKAKGKLEVGGGFNNISQRTNFIGRASYNQRFFANDRVDDGRLGISLSGSYFSTQNGRDRVQYNYTSNYTNIGTRQYVLPTYYRLRDLENLRTRTGAAATIDFKFNSRSSVYFNLMYSRRYDLDREKRTQFDFNRAQFGFADADSLTPTSNNATTVRRQVNPREFNTRNLTYSFGGEHGLGKMTMDWLFFRSVGNNRANDGRFYDFRSLPLQTNLDGFYTDYLNVTARNPETDITSPFLISDVRAYTDQATIIRSSNTAAKVNFKLPFKVREHDGLFKFGGKLRQITNSRRLEIDRREFVPDGVVNEAALFPSFVSNREDQQFFQDRVRFGPTLDNERADAFIAANQNLFVSNATAQQNNLNEATPAFYDAEENVYAFYAMSRLQIKRLMILGGLRYEGTNVNYVGNQYESDAGGNIIGSTVRQADGGRNFGFLLPNFHLKYSINNLTNIRAAFTRSFARANFTDLVPRQDISINNQEIEIGNARLNPATSSNFDLMFERYQKNVGIFSGGVFYKRINGFIFSRSFVEPRTVTITGPDGQPVTETLDFTITTPDNGEVADLVGGEVNVQTNLSFLPGILSGLGVYANYTFTHSNASTFERKNIRLPGQARHTANLALSFDYKGFSSRASFNFNGGVIRSLGPGAFNGVSTNGDFDVFRNDRYQLDLSASYAFKKGIRIYCEFINLTNRPELEYFGRRNRPSNVEFYDWWNRFGVAYSF
ncbi:MAG: TonB-dependent receptor [Cytophagales bacterium]|nr:TonB-dependent receptor [Cytophagales bacterium]